MKPCISHEEDRAIAVSDARYLEYLSTVVEEADRILPVLEGLIDIIDQVETPVAKLDKIKAILCGVSNHYDEVRSEYSRDLRSWFGWPHQESAS